MKKLLTLFMAIVMIVGTVSFMGCGPTGWDDPTKTHLYVANYNGGSGGQWLKDVKTRFEQKYVNESFEPGKKGIVIHDDSDKDYAGNVIATKLGSDSNHVYFTSGYDYFVRFSLSVLSSALSSQGRWSPNLA